MKKNLLIVQLFICASFGLTVGAGAQGLPSEIGGEYVVGKNLTGDECKLRRTRPGDWGGKAERYLLYCEGWSQPSGQLLVLRQGKQPHAWWLEESDWAQDIRASGECEAPKAETGIEGVAAMVRSCQHRLGWRRLMLAAKSGRDLFLADFLPNNAPLIERALLVSMKKMSPETSVAQGKRMIALRAMEELIGTDTDLPSIKEIGNIVELISLGRQQHEARLYRQSELTWQRVLKTQERIFGLSNPALASTLLYMTHPVRNQRRVDDALALMERAEPFVSKSHDPVLIAQRLTNLVHDANWRRNHEAAAAFAEKAINILPDRNLGMLAEAYYALAGAKRGIKDFTGAEEAARKTLELYNKTEGFYGVWTNRGRMFLVRILTEQKKKFVEAKAHLADALHSAEKMFGRTIWWANAKVLEARLAGAMGHPAQAMEAYRAFAAVAAREEFSCFYGPCFSPYLDLLAGQIGADSEAAQAALREAFSVVQLMDFPVVSTAINQLAARVGAGDQEISVYTREQQDLAERQARLRAQLMQETRKPEKNRSEEKEDVIDREIRQLGARLDERELMLQDRFPKYAQLVARKPVEALQIDEILQPEEGLLYFSHVGDKGYTFLLHQGRLKLHAVNLSDEELKRKVKALRGELALEGGKVRPFNASLAHALYRDLVGSLLDAPGSICRLVIVPTGPLLSLPPDVLVSAAPGTTGKTEWLVRRFGILVAPDVRSLMDLRGIGKSPVTSSGFLGVGNPKFDAGVSGAALAVRASDAEAKNRGLHIVTSDQKSSSDACGENWNVRAQVAKLAPLPESADEVQSMSTELIAGKGTLLLGEKATKYELLKAGLETKEIIAFATHGLLPEDLYCESEPSLALAPGSHGNVQDDGVLRASEIAMMRLNANLVILSACNTAGADGQLGGESLSGLARAFFYAGARNVLATHWPIASQPTVELTTGMVRKRAQGLNWSDALRESKLRMMDNPATSHPFFWGAFSLVGGG
jgi:CHAT domain-containing protein/tetratricopeptide (TPR) repeat protein